MQTKEEMITWFKALPPDEQKTLLTISDAWGRTETMETIGVVPTAKTQLLADVGNALYNKSQGKTNDYDQAMLTLLDHLNGDHDLS